MPHYAIIVNNQDAKEYAKAIKTFLLSDSERRRKEDVLEGLKSSHSGENMVANFLDAIQFLEESRV